MAFSWSGMASNQRYAPSIQKYFFYCVDLEGNFQQKRIRSRPNGREAGDGPYSCTWIRSKGNGYSRTGYGNIYLGSGDSLEGYNYNGKSYFSAYLVGRQYIEYNGTYTSRGWDGIKTVYNIAPAVGSLSTYYYEKRRYAPGEPFSFTFDGDVYESGEGDSRAGWQNVSNWQLTPLPPSGSVDVSYTPLEDYVSSGAIPSLDRWLSKAYTDAVMQLPWTTMNNIANVLDTAKMIVGILGGRLDSIGSLSDMWLAYRYVWSTTKMDVDEAGKILERLSGLAETTKITSNSVVQVDGFTIRCAVELDSDAFIGARNFAKKWGLELSAYNAWDMVPYSFIVDWFLDVGGKLEYYEGWGNAVKLAPVANVWFSISDSQSSDGTTVSRYYRWTERPPVVTPVYVSYAAGKRTLIKRGIDVLAIFG